jgi:hypothetical protein
MGEHTRDLLLVLAGVLVLGHAMFCLWAGLWWLVFVDGFLLVCLREALFDA